MTTLCTSFVSKSHWESVGIMVISFYYPNVLFVGHMNDKLIKKKFRIKLLAKFEKNAIGV
jgi:hypothetical protein